MYNYKCMVLCDYAIALGFGKLALKISTVLCIILLTAIMPRVSLPSKRISGNIRVVSHGAEYCNGLKVTPLAFSRGGFGYNVKGGLPSGIYVDA